MAVPQSSDRRYRAVQSFFSNLRMVEIKEGGNMEVITREMKVGDIARLWPETMKVFARYNLDLCCGGGHTLEFVAAKHGLDLEDILAELNQLAVAGRGPGLAALRNHLEKHS